jgi:hypothetical protein
MHECQHIPTVEAHLQQRFLWSNRADDLEDIKYIFFSFLIDFLSFSLLIAFSNVSF